MEVKTYIEFLGKTIALGGLILGVFSFVQKSNSEISERRYQYFVDLVESYNDTISDRERAIYGKLQFYHQHGVIGLDAEISLELYDQVFDDVVLSADDTQEDTGFFVLSRVAAFYEEVSFCIRSQMCLTPETNDFFCPRMQTFSNRTKRIFSHGKDRYGMFLEFKNEEAETIICFQN